MNTKLRKGTRVRIIKDVRSGAPAEGKIGKYVGDEDHTAWILITANGQIERESYDLPDDYVEWSPNTEAFPKKNCGIRTGNPRFELDDGTVINGGECYWGPVNPKIEKRMLEEYREFLRKTGTPEEQIPTIEDLLAQKNTL